MQVIEPHEATAPVAAKCGRLDGWTIVRFAHAYESGGGLEQYLSDLNRALGQRNRLTIVQIQMTTDQSRLGESSEEIGQARLIKVPMWVQPESKYESINAHEPGIVEKCKTSIRQRFLFAAPVFQAITRRKLRHWQVPRRAGEPDGAREKFRELLGRFNVNLVVVHSGGGADASEILDIAERAEIPALMIHHFANDRLASMALGSQILQTRAVGGVCGVNVPSFVRARFSNLADGIDTDFFHKDGAKPVIQKVDRPILFLPARITATKGQLDLVRAGGELLRQGLQFQIAFAGRVDSDEFKARLEKEIQAAGLRERVTFAGQLDASGLRDWYAASAVLAFPTHHHEGLPRIVLEAQAMKLPVVVHDIGGTSEGIVHDKTGYLVPVGNQQVLVERLAELLQNPEQRQQLGEAGRKLIEEKFSLQSLAERHESFYLDAMKL